MCLFCCFYKNVYFIMLNVLISICQNLSTKEISHRYPNYDSPITRKSRQAEINIVNATEHNSCLSPLFFAQRILTILSRIISGISITRTNKLLTFHVGNNIDNRRTSFHFSPCQFHLDHDMRVSWYYVVSNHCVWLYRIIQTVIELQNIFWWSQ